MFFSIVRVARVSGATRAAVRIIRAGIAVQACIRAIGVAGVGITVVGSVEVKHRHILGNCCTHHNFHIGRQFQWQPGQ